MILWDVCLADAAEIMIIPEEDHMQITVLADLTDVTDMITDDAPIASQSSLFFRGGFNQQLIYIISKSTLL